MREGETISQLHRQFKEILNNLHEIGEWIKNHDLIKYTLKTFPWSNLWSSIVDAYKVCRDLSTIKLDKLFYEFKLHEQSNLDSKEKGIDLVLGKVKSKKDKKELIVEIELGMQGEEEEGLNNEISNFVKKMLERNKNFTSET